MNSDKNRGKGQRSMFKWIVPGHSCVFTEPPVSCSWHAFLSACPVCLLSSFKVRPMYNVSAWHCINETGDTFKKWCNTRPNFVFSSLTTPGLLFCCSFVFINYNNKILSAFLTLLLGMNEVKGSLSVWNVLYTVGLESCNINLCRPEKFCNRCYATQGKY